MAKRAYGEKVYEEKQYFAGKIAWSARKCGKLMLKISDGDFSVNNSVETVESRYFCAGFYIL